MKMQFWPCGGGEPLYLNQTDWCENLGSGGFASAQGNPKDPSRVLKKLHLKVAYIDALPTMTILAIHSATMQTRLRDILLNDPPPLVRRVCSSLLSTLTTHVGYHEDSIYLLQNKAHGLALRSLVNNEEPPAWPSRIRIAKNLASAMAALRRCGVVHLDCSPDNVFVGPQPSYNVTLIDLDGCGVLAGGLGVSQDKWKIAPMTLGRSDEIYPVWFPIDPSWQRPLSGNFKFAERWVLISEIWRILSWGGTAMFWLDEQFNELFEAFDVVRQNFSSRIRENNSCEFLKENERAALLNECINEARSAYYTLWSSTPKPAFTPEMLSVDKMSPFDIKFLMNFAQLTQLAFFYPKSPLFDQLGSEPLGEMPNAKWAQDQLINLLAAQ